MRVLTSFDVIHLRKLSSVTLMARKGIGQEGTRMQVGPYSYKEGGKLMVVVLLMMMLLLLLLLPDWWVFHLPGDVLCRGVLNKRRVCHRFDNEDGRKDDLLPQRQALGQRNHRGRVRN